MGYLCLVGWTSAYLWRIYKNKIVTPFDVFTGPLLVLLTLAALISATAVLGKEFSCIIVDLGCSDVSVSKFMNNQPANDDGFDPVSMNGYRYPLRCGLKSDKVISFKKKTKKQSPSTRSGNAKAASSAQVVMITAARDSRTCVWPTPCISY